MNEHKIKKTYKTRPIKYSNNQLRIVYNIYCVYNYIIIVWKNFFSLVY